MSLSDPISLDSLFLFSSYSLEKKVNPSCVTLELPVPTPVDLFLAASTITVLN